MSAAKSLGIAPFAVTYCAATFFFSLSPTAKEYWEELCEIDRKFKGKDEEK